MARGDALPDSDVDLIAEIDPRMSFSLLDFVGLQDFLRDLLGRRVDISTTGQDAAAHPPAVRG